MKKFKILRFHTYGAPQRVAQTMERIYKECDEILIPFMQNDILDRNGIHDHLCTVGRYDINSSCTWNMTDVQKKLAQHIYKGKRCYEFPFFVRNTDDVQIAVVISRTGATATLVFEGRIEHKGFVISPSGDSYLKDGFISSEKIIQIIKTLV